MKKETLKIDGLLSEIDRFITMLAQSSSLCSSLSIEIPGEELRVNMHHAKGRPIDVCIYVEIGMYWFSVNVPFGAEG